MRSEWRMLWAAAVSLCSCAAFAQPRPGCVGATVRADPACRGRHAQRADRAHRRGCGRALRGHGRSRQDRARLGRRQRTPAADPAPADRCGRRRQAPRGGHHAGRQRRRRRRIDRRQLERQDPGVPVRPRQRPHAAPPARRVPHGAAPELQRRRSLARGLALRRRPAGVGLAARRPAAGRPRLRRPELVHRLQPRRPARHHGPRRAGAAVHARRRQAAPRGRAEGPWRSDPGGRGLRARRRHARTRLRGRAARGPARRPQPRPGIAARVSSRRQGLPDGPGLRRRWPDAAGLRPARPAEPQPRLSLEPAGPGSAAGHRRTLLCRARDRAAAARRLAARRKQSDVGPDHGRRPLADAGSVAGGRHALFPRQRLPARRRRLERAVRLPAARCRAASLRPEEPHPGARRAAGRTAAAHQRARGGGLRGRHRAHVGRSHTADAAARACARPGGGARRRQLRARHRLPAEALRCRWPADVGARRAGLRLGREPAADRTAGWEGARRHLRRRQHPLAPHQRRPGAAGAVRTCRPTPLGAVDAVGLLRRQRRRRRTDRLAPQPRAGPGGGLLPGVAFSRALPPARRDRPRARHAGRGRSTEAGRRRPQPARDAAAGTGPVAAAGGGGAVRHRPGHGGARRSRCACVRAPLPTRR